MCPVRATSDPAGPVHLDRCRPGRLPFAATLERRKRINEARSAVSSRASLWRLPPGPSSRRRYSPGSRQRRSLRRPSRSRATRCTIVIGDDTSMQVYNSNVPGSRPVLSARTAAPVRRPTRASSSGLGGDGLRTRLRQSSAAAVGVQHVHAVDAGLAVARDRDRNLRAIPFTVVVVVDAGATQIRLTETHHLRQRRTGRPYHPRLAAFPAVGRRLRRRASPRSTPSSAPTSTWPTTTRGFGAHGRHRDRRPRQPTPTACSCSTRSSSAAAPRRPTGALDRLRHGLGRDLGRLAVEQRAIRRSARTTARRSSGRRIAIPVLDRHRRVVHGPGGAARGDGARAVDGGHRDCRSSAGRGGLRPREEDFAGGVRRRRGSVRGPCEPFGAAFGRPFFFAARHAPASAGAGPARRCDQLARVPRPAASGRAGSRPTDAGAKSGGAPGSSSAMRRAGLRPPARREEHGVDAAVAGELLERLLRVAAVMTSTEGSRRTRSEAIAPGAADDEDRDHGAFSTQSTASAAGPRASRGRRRCGRGSSRGPRWRGVKRKREVAARPEADACPAVSVPTTLHGLEALGHEGQPRLRDTSSACARWPGPASGAGATARARA